MTFLLVVFLMFKGGVMTENDMQAVVSAQY